MLLMCIIFEGKDHGGTCQGKQAFYNIGRQGVQELFFGNNKSQKVVNNACQSMVLRTSLVH